ncbi:MAG: VWA domain-containing protein [Kofleriaceae bacterium]
MRWIVVAIVGVASTASAYEDDHPVVVPSRVVGRLEGHTAHYTIQVRRAVKAGVHNDFAIDVPRGGVIVSASVQVDGHAHALALDERTKIDAAWDAMAGDAITGTPPWMIAIHQDSIAIAAPRAATVTFDLEIEATTCYTRDRRYADLPASWRSLTNLHVTKPDGTCAKTSGLAVSWPVTEAKTATDRIAIRGERLDLEANHYAHAELALAGRISDVPNDLATVFVIDASRSMTEADVIAMQRTIESYAQHAPHSQIQVVAYARKARVLLPTWTNARAAVPRITRELANLTLANGSNADAGLDVAGNLLKDVKGTRRVVLFDDEMLPDRVSGISAEKLKQLLPAGTLVHVVALGNFFAGREGFGRDDTISFAPLAIATEGWAARVFGGDKLDAEELVRPIALDQIELKTTGWDRGVFDVEGSCIDRNVDERMTEGSGCEWWAGADYAAGNITLDALVWNHKIHREITLADDGERLARSYAGEGRPEDDVQEAAHAVTQRWSLAVSWGGTGTYAFEPRGGTSGWGCGCDGAPGTIGHGMGGQARIRTTSDVQQQVAGVTAKCHAGPSTIELELTQHEIVGVTVTSSPDDRDCLTEAVWDLALFRNDPVAHERVVVRL